MGIECYNCGYVASNKKDTDSIEKSDTESLYGKICPNCKKLIKANKREFVIQNELKLKSLQEKVRQAIRERFNGDIK